MDKVRAFVNIMWTQRFWVLTILCTTIGTVCWNMAAADLDTQFKKRKGEIDGAFSTVRTISGEQVHPNDDVNRGDMDQARLQRDYVLKVWQELYQRQRTEVLYWPESIGEEFVSYMEKRKFGDSIKSDMLGFYHDYIETRFDALLEIVDAKKMAESGASGRGYGGEFGGEGGGYGGEFGGASMLEGDGLAEEGYLVQWLDQGKIQQKLMFPTKPTVMQVWVTQEDLWVYETLLNVIAETNKARGATLPDNTAVRAIELLQVGSEAAGTVSDTGAGTTTGQVYMPLPTEGGYGGEMGGYGGEMGGYGGEMGGYGGEMGGYGGEMGGGFGEEMGGYGGEMGGYGGEMGGREGGGDASLVYNRYLDAEGKPDPGTSGAYGTTEFRQLPIRMKLFMDQRWIPRILIECANAALPVEVKQLRVNPSQSGSGLGSRSSSSSLSRGIRGMAPDVSLAEVEIRGVVYIYNEPDTETLTITGDEGEEGVALADDSL